MHIEVRHCDWWEHGARFCKGSQRYDLSCGIWQLEVKSAGPAPGIYKYVVECHHIAGKEFSTFSTRTYFATLVSLHWYLECSRGPRKSYELLKKLTTTKNDYEDLLTWKQVPESVDIPCCFSLRLCTSSSTPSSLYPHRDAKVLWESQSWLQLQIRYLLRRSDSLKWSNVRRGLVLTLSEAKKSMLSICKWLPCKKTVTVLATVLFNRMARLRNTVNRLSTESPHALEKATAEWPGYYLNLPMISVMYRSFETYHTGDIVSYTHSIPCTCWKQLHPNLLSHHGLTQCACHSTETWELFDQNKLENCLL